MLPWTNLQEQQLHARSFRRVTVTSRERRNTGTLLVLRAGRLIVSSDTSSGMRNQETFGLM